MLCCFSLASDLISVLLFLVPPSLLLRLLRACLHRSVGEYQTLDECRDAIDKLSGAALDGNIVKLTPLVSVRWCVNIGRACRSSRPGLYGIW